MDASNNPDLQGSVHAVMRTGKIKAITWGRLHEAAQEDPLMVKLTEVVLRGFPQSSYDVDEELRIYLFYLTRKGIASPFPFIISSIQAWITV